MKRFIGIFALFAVLALISGCASTPTQTDNACAVLAQKNGWITNWRRAAKKAENEYGIPMPIILATIYTESGYRQRAKPPRRKLLGFIPWKRPSTAYGYSQALKGTWEHYKRDTGHSGASRTSFGDTTEFIGWFYREAVLKNRVSPNNAYALYLNYYLGWTAYARGTRSAAAETAARRAANMAARYDTQLRRCGKR